MNKRIDIQILRALAVIFVVLFHLEVTGIESGFLGVDVFFVVSGFLMAILYQEGQSKQFFTRRAKRLLPAYFVTVGVTILVALFVVKPSELPQVAEQSIYSLFFANNFGFWAQNSYFSKSDFNPLLHLWSLAVEIQFYLFVPLLAWFFRKSKLFLWLGFLGSLAACIFILGLSPKTSFFMMPLRVWEFLIGFIVAYYFTQNGLTKYQQYTWLGVVGLVGLCLIPLININGESVSRITGHPGLYALLVCLATALVLAFGLPKYFLQHKIGQYLAKIGDYSYSIYLVHFPIIVLYLYEPFSGTQLHPHSIIDQVILFLFIIVAAWLMYHYVENRKFDHINKVYASSLLGIVTLAIATKYVPYFYDEKSKHLFNALYDRGQIRCGKLVRITDPTALSCQLNSENFAQSVYFLGNSHADAAKEAFTAVASKHQFNTYFSVSNESLLTSNVSPEMVIADMQRLKSNHLVVHYASRQLNAPKFEVLEKLVDLAEQQKIKVDFILPVPIYQKPIPKIMYEQPQIQSLYTKQEYFKDNADLLADLNQLTTRYQNLKLFTVIDQFCPTQDCAFANTKGQPYYFDSNHVTLTGAQLMTPIFEQVFKHS